MKRLMLIFAFALAVATAQPGINPPSSPPDNGYGADPGQRHHFPNDIPGYTYCAWHTQNNLTYPAAGEAYFLTASVWGKSGWHDHQGPGSLPRPVPTIVGAPQQGYLPSNGCIDFHVDLPGVAGWYVITGGSPNFPVKGINQHTFVYTWDTFLRQEIPLVPYPNDTTINVQQSAHADISHFSGGFSFYVQKGIVQDLQSASRKYRSATSALGIADRINLTRCSLPDGGIADNDRPDYGPGPLLYGIEWAPRANEQHFRGNECDVVNSKTISADHSAALVQALQNEGCILGVADSDDNLIVPNPSIEAFWRAKDIMHVTCGHSPSERVPHKGPF